MIVIRQRKPNRLKNFNYSSSGYYFITICTKDRQKYFGNIINDKMILNQYGNITKQCWNDISKHFKNIELDEFQIMPNHVHGIIIIEYTNQSVGNAYMRSLQTNHWQYRTKMLLPKIIHEFKSATSRFIRKHNSSFQWQKSFYDHIIRNEYSLFRIRQYIRDNPINWNEDRNNSDYR
ncbi:MAG: transposase [Patescibacteria group bacterium]